MKFNVRCVDMRFDVGSTENFEPNVQENPIQHSAIYERESVILWMASGETFATIESNSI